MRRIALRTLQRQGIQVRLKTKVVRVGAGEVELETGEILTTNTPVWVAGIKPAPVVIEPEPGKAASGRMAVNEYWQLLDYQNVFVLGDMAAPAPALAQAASREAKAVANNIYRLIKNKKPRRYIYRHTGDLVSLGRWMAVGNVAGITISGKFAWWLWRMVYISKMLSWRKKLKVAVDWIINLFSARDISEL